MMKDKVSHQTIPLLFTNLKLLWQRHDDLLVYNPRSNCWHCSSILNMPLFPSKFCPKKTQPRKFDRTVGNKCQNSRDQEEFGLEIGPIKLRLGDQEAVFENGEWIPENGPTSSKYRENERLRLSIQRLEDENNMLKLKSEILMDMLTQTTAESHLQAKVIEMLKTTKSTVKKVHNR